jgi:hypothetical protein
MEAKPTYIYSERMAGSGGKRGKKIGGKQWKAREENRWEAVKSAGRKYAGTQWCGKPSNL